MEKEKLIGNLVPKKIVNKNFTENFIERKIKKNSEPKNLGIGKNHHLSKTKKLKINTTINNYREKINNEILLKNEKLKNHINSYLVHLKLQKIRNDLINENLTEQERNLPFVEIILAKINNPKHSSVDLSINSPVLKEIYNHRFNSKSIINNNVYSTPPRKRGGNRPKTPTHLQRLQVD